MKSVKKNLEPMERRFIFQKQLNLKLRRKALPNNLCCGLFDYDELINNKKQEGLLVYLKYFSSAINDEYTSRSIGESKILKRKTCLLRLLRELYSPLRVNSIVRT